MLPLPKGSTRGKQSTKIFSHFRSARRVRNGDCVQDDGGNAALKNGSTGMLGRTADDEGEYASRADKIEAWLKTYGGQYLGGSVPDDTGGTSETLDEYRFHGKTWTYVILDDRPSAAKPGTPLFDRFVFTTTKMGLSEEDAEKAIKLLRCFGP